jgi:hypothetical protein
VLSRPLSRTVEQLSLVEVVAERAADERGSVVSRG